MNHGAAMSARVFFAFAAARYSIACRRDGWRPAGAIRTPDAHRPTSARFCQKCHSSANLFYAMPLPSCVAAVREMRRR